MKYLTDSNSLVLVPETEMDYYEIGCLSQKIAHTMTWSKEDLGGGEFQPRQMKIDLKHLVALLIAVPPKKG